MLSILPKSLCHSFSRWSQRRTCTRRRHLESSIWCFLMERVTSRMQARFCGRSILTSHCWTWHQACYSLFFADVYTKVKSTLCLRKEGSQHFWCSEAQPLGDVQEVQPSTQSWCPPWIRLLQLKNVIMATILSKEFIHLHVFSSVCQVLMNPDFWKWAFVMCRALHAPMRAFRLATKNRPQWTSCLTMFFRLIACSL